MINYQIKLNNLKKYIRFKRRGDSKVYSLMKDIVIYYKIDMKNII